MNYKINGRPNVAEILEKVMLLAFRPSNPTSPAAPSAAPKKGPGSLGPFLHLRLW